MIVRFRTGLSTAMVTVMVSFPLIGAAFAVRAETDAQRVVLLAIAVTFPSLLLLGVLVGVPPVDWDLRRRVFVRPRSRRELPFGAVRRVMVFRGARGYAGMDVWADHGRIRGVRWDLSGGRRRRMRREHWVALRVLLDEPGISRVEYYPWGISERRTQRPPARSMSREEAARDVDGRIAAMDAGLSWRRVPPLFTAFRASVQP